MRESYLKSKSELLEQELEHFTHIRGRLKQLLGRHGETGDSMGEVSFPGSIPLVTGWRISISEFEEGAFSPHSLQLSNRAFKDLLVLDLLASDENDGVTDEWLEARSVAAPLTLLISGGEIIHDGTGYALTLDELIGLRQDVDTIITPYVEANFSVQ